MHTRTLGRDCRSPRSGSAHGHVPELRPQPRRPRRHDRRAALRRRAGRHLLRHRRGLRPVRQRGTRRRGAGAVRDQVVIATKFGWDIQDGQYASGSTAGPSRSAGSPKRRCSGCGVDAIDLFYQHRVDPDVPIEDVAGAVGELVAAGKVRHFGLSEAARRRRSAARTPCTRSPRCRASTRCGPAIPKPRCCRPAPSWASGSCRSARSARGSSPAPSTRRRTFAAGDIRATIPRFERREPRRQPGARRPGAAHSRDARDATPGAGRAGVAARPAAVDRADPRDPPHASASRRTPARPRSRCPPTTSPTSTRSSSRIGVAGNRYNAAGMKMVNL